MQNYTLPGFWEQQSVIIPFLILYRKYNFLFKNNINIDSAYGNFYKTIWDGGRNQNIIKNISNTSFEDIINFQNIYNNILNIPIRFIFTNCFLTKEHCKDKYCNFILDTFSQYPNQITINSEILEKYILEKNYNYKLISSITKQLKKEEILLELNKPQYIQICLPSKYNKNENFLFNTIPKEFRIKCELIINTSCPLNCISAKIHNEIDSYDNLYNCNKKYIFPCAKLIKNNLLNTTLSPTDLIKYENKNLNHFKLVERMFIDPLKLIQALLIYLIKPQYYKTVKDILFYYHNNWNTIDLNNFNLNNFNFNIKKQEDYF